MAHFEGAASAPGPSAAKFAVTSRWRPTFTRECLSVRACALEALKNSQRRRPLRRLDLVVDRP